MTRSETRATLVLFRSRRWPSHRMEIDAMVTDLPAELSRVDLWEALHDFDRAEHRPPTAVELSAALGLVGRHLDELRDITRGER